MKAHSKPLTLLLIVLTVTGIFAYTPYLYAQNDQAVAGGRKAIVEGAKQMLEGSKKIMAVLQKKGLADEEIMALNRQMMDGYDLVMKGNGMMTGGTMAQGEEMMEPICKSLDGSKRLQ